MALDFLAAALVAPITKHLVKLAFGEGLASEIGAGATDWWTAKLGDYGAGKAELSVKTIARRTLRELEPLFEHSQLSPHGKQNVAEALGRTLQEIEVARLVIAERFESKPLLTALEAGRPTAKDDLDPEAYGLYRQVRAGIAAAFRRVGSKLPSFHEHTAKATLDALDALALDIGGVLAGSRGRKPSCRNSRFRSQRQHKSRPRSQTRTSAAIAMPCAAMSQGSGCLASTSRRGHLTSCRWRSPTSPAAHAG
jgi:hypothetical protein